MISLRRFIVPFLAFLLIFQVAIPGSGNTVHAATDGFITFKYDSFSNDGRMKINGSTVYSSNRLRLTPAAEQQWGTAFNVERVSLKDDRSFSSYFTFELSSGGGYTVGWADGIVFTVQTYSNSAGAAGGGMGYQGIPQSVGIEFDTWNNGPSLTEPDANHIGVDINGVLGSNKVVSLPTDTLNMKSGTIHAWVDYNGATKTIEVRVNKNSSTRPATATLTETNVNLTSILNSNDVYVGFTAATGGAYQIHDITKWYFTNEYAPIDVNNNTYAQAPTSYTIAKTQQEDGSWKLDITAVGGSRQNNIPITVTATNGGIVEPSSVTTDANGKAVVYVSSGETTGDSTVKAEGPSGIYSTATVALAGKTSAPLANNIVANATDQDITLSNVPADTIISVYRSESDSTPVQFPATAGGAVTLTAEQLGFDLSIEDDIYITYKTGTKLESNKTTITPMLRSEALTDDQIVSNGTKDTVYVTDVPAGATVRVYDSVSGQLIGQATADSSANPLAVSIAGGLLDLQEVKVTIQESNEIESFPTSATTRLEKSDNPVNVTANAATDMITVQNVPNGAKVIVYDSNGDEIASIYNRTGQTRDTAIDMSPPGIENGDAYRVSIIEVKKYESDKVAVTGQTPSPSLTADQIAANATTDAVTVANIAPGATVRVYDANGVLLGEAANTSDKTGAVAVAIAAGLAAEQQVSVTQQREDELESAKQVATALSETSVAPTSATANATKDTVTVSSVPAGATVKVYNAAGTLIGTATNSGAASAAVEVAIAAGLNAGDSITATITELNKSESASVSAVAKDEASGVTVGTITANGTKGTVKVANVPKGATVIVYDSNGHELGRLTQSIAAGSLTVPGLTNMGDTIYVSIVTADHLESGKVPQAVTYDLVSELTADQVLANATNNTVTVTGVAAGATITVYDDQGHAIGTATNTGNASGTVVVELSIDLADGASVFVAKKDSNKSVSEPIEIFAANEQSATPTAVVANSSTDTVTVKNVPAGATVTVYDDEEMQNVIGHAENTGNEPKTVVVEIVDGLNDQEPVYVTLTEANKKESEPAVSTAKPDGDSAIIGAIAADGINGTVTVEDVPAGATIIVYDANGNELGRLTQGGTAGDLTLSGLSGLGDTVYVSITLPNQLESSKVAQAVDYGQSSKLDSEQVSVNATSDEATVANVPAGATVTVYAEDGTIVLGTATNEGTGPSTVIVSLAPGVEDGDTVQITLKEHSKRESEPLEATAEYDPSNVPLTVIANATADTVAVDLVPAGATVTVYDEDGTTVLGTAVNNGSTAGPVVVNIDAPGLEPGDVVQVSVKETNKSESGLTASTALAASDSLSADDVEANGTAGTVTVHDVPANATVIVYDKDGRELGRLTQGDDAGDLTLSGLGDLGEQIYVSIAEEGKLASEAVPYTVVYTTSESLQDGQVAANATRDTVTVTDVPVGATIIVYNAGGDEIGRAVNEGANAGDVIVAIAEPGLANNETIGVAIQEPNKNISDPIDVKAEYEPSAAPTDAEVNATSNKVSVAGVPAGAAVTVYNADDEVIGTGVNSASSTAAIVILLNDGVELEDGDTVSITITEVDKSESEPGSFTARVESSQLDADDISADGTKGQVTVDGVPAGATVNVYDADGNLIGTVTNTGDDAATVVVTITVDIADDETVSVTLTEAGKAESEPVPINLGYDQSPSLDADRIYADATNDQVTVSDVPAGATIYIYSAGGSLLGSIANTGVDAADLTVKLAAPGLAVGDTVNVSIQEAGKRESAKTTATAKANQSKALVEQQVTVNAATDQITIREVPAGSTVRIYDSTGKLLISRKNTTSGETTLSIAMSPGFDAGAQFQLSLTELNKEESAKLTVTALGQSAKLLPTQIVDIDTREGTVQVQQVPPGATVVAYDEAGNEIGRATNTSTGDAEVIINGEGPLAGSPIRLTIIEAGKLESVPLDVVITQSATLAADQVVSNGTKNVVYVTNAAEGAIVRVYDQATGDLIGQAVATGGADPLAVSIAGGLADLQVVAVTIKEKQKAESQPVAVTTRLEKSANPVKVDANATTDRITVKQVPDNAKVIVYDLDGDEIASITNRSGEVRDMVIDMLPQGFALGDRFAIAIVEEKKYESDKVAAIGEASASTLPADNVSADATTDRVTVADVAPGAVIRVYDANGTLIGQATNEGSTNREVTVEIAAGLADEQPVFVTAENTGEVEGTAVRVVATSDQSAALPAESITANATDDTVTVANVPAGATVKVYDEEGNVIGTATNNGSTTGTVTVTIDDGFDEADIVSVTIKEPNKSESGKTPATAQTESEWSDDYSIHADGTEGTVTVDNVPAGATIIVYDKDGNELGRLTQGEEPGSLTLEHLQGMGEEIQVSIIVEGHLESAPQQAVVDYTASGELEAITANATDDTVTVANVPAGATIKVYDDQGNLIGTATNNSGTDGPVVVTIPSGLSDGQVVDVTITEKNKAESGKSPVTAVNDQSTELPAESITANATDDTVTVTNVPPGATVTVYDKEGEVIGTATNNGGTAATVTVTIDGGLDEADIVSVTIKEPNKSESGKAEATAKTESEWPEEISIVAKGTEGTVTVDNVPAGATIIVYDQDGNELGRLTQGEESGTLTLEHLQGMGEEIQVSIIIEGYLESAPQQAVVDYTTSGDLAEAITANATNDTVTVANVPAGATIKVYDEYGNLIGMAVNNSGVDGPVVVTIPSGLKDGQVVDVTITEKNKTESDKTSATAVNDPSETPTASSITANATDNTVTVTNVPAGATVTVYDEENNVIGTATNSGGTAGTVTVTIDGGLDEADIVSVTIKEPNKSESGKAPVTVQTESAWSDEYSIHADGTAGKVTVDNVPAGATIIVYDQDGNELGRLTQGEESGTLTLEDLQGMGEEIQVSIITEGHLESAPQQAVVDYTTSGDLAEAITANATNDTVTVANVPAGATIKVYDEHGNLIGTATNNSNTDGPVVVTIPSGLSAGQVVDVTITEKNKAESAKTSATAVNDPSEQPTTSSITANATDNTVTVTNVPAGATVTVYDDENNVIGTATSSGSTAGTVTVTIGGGLDEAETVYVTITEANKAEGAPAPATSQVKSDPLTGSVSANATQDTVAIAAVPAGATIYVYNAANQLIGTLTNDGLEPADLTIAAAAPGLAGGDTVKVSVKEPGKLESSTIAVIAVLEQTASLDEAQVAVNATTDIITVKDVAPGATVRVYDSTGKLIISRKNTTSGSTTLVITMNPGFDAGDHYSLSVSEPNKQESVKLNVIARDQSSMPSSTQIESISIEQDTIVLQDIPNGATVVAYDANGNEVGRATNDSGSTGEVTIKGPITTNEMQFTLIESGKLESDKLIVDLLLTTEEQINNALRRLSVQYQVQDTWESVTNNVYVLTVGAHDTQVQWQSSKPGVVTINTPSDNRIEATVARQANDESVILTAEISKNGIAKSRTFLLIVKSASLNKTSEVVQRQVDISGGEGQEHQQQVDVNRITMSDGSKIDKAIFDASSADTFTGNPLTADSPAIIYVNEDTDPADEYAIEIPQQSVSLLANNGNSLDVRTDYAQLRISSEVLARMNESFLDLFFRIVPVKDEDVQAALNSQIPNESAVRQAASGRQVTVLGSSLEVETNYSNYSTTLFIPFAKNGIVIPTDNATSFLDSLRVYIEHSDGEKAVQQGTVVYQNDEPIGLEIVIDKFSRFTVIRLTNSPIVVGPSTPADTEDGADTEDETEQTPDTAYHSAYMRGYVDGTFRPNASISRSEMAAILFRVNELEELDSFKQLYPDVNANHWAALNIERLKELGWMVGDTNGNFRPEAGITRAEMALIIARWLKLELPAEAQSGFKDVRANHWASQAIAAVSKAGYMIGDGDGEFKPGRNLTRAEAVTIINRVLNRGPLNDTPDSSWKDVDRNYWAYGDIEEASRNHYYTKLEEGVRGEHYIDSK
ncbi:S-layer homology domain-containing protein [Cohnella fermenti]|uniref:SLH domain-containing protein n=1 Tax=Cohnella fermenti TaxID=2565925 RepID=A0A4S4BHF8_9BACL|nr:S-layer homology domain-containing protein [Cohnella fermenti]THF73980.1 hypothetical protein E6C55_26740 [Cohnella fermenti]